MSRTKAKQPWELVQIPQKREEMNLKEIRLARGMTQEQLADKVGIERTSITNYELGTREPSLDTLRKLAEALDCTLDELIGRKS